MIPIFDLHNFCEGLPADVQREIDKVSKYRVVEAGTTIVRIGDIHQYVHQLVAGHVIYCSCDSRGRETVTAVMKPGDWIGLSEVFTDGPAMADVVAATDGQLRTISRNEFELLLDAHPVVSRHLLKLFSLRFGIVYRLAQDQRELTLKERLLKLLHRMAFSAGQNGPGAVIDLSQEELARMLSASRQTLNRLLRELEREGLLTLNYRAIQLIDRARVERSYDFLLVSEIS